MSYAQTTKCPHCGAPTFAPLLDANKRPYLAVQELQRIESPGRYHVSLARPALEVVFKVCGSCGFVGQFSRQICTP